MISARHTADINNREDREMGVVIVAAVALVVGLFAGFNQKAEDPNAHTFLESNSHIVHDGSAD